MNVSRYFVAYFTFVGANVKSANKATDIFVNFKLFHVSGRHLVSLKVTWTQNISIKFLKNFNIFDTRVFI